MLVSFTVKAFKIGWDEATGPGRLLGGVRILPHAAQKDLATGCLSNCLGKITPNAQTLAAWRDYALHKAPPEVSCSFAAPAGAPIFMNLFTYKVLVLQHPPCHMAIALHTPAWDCGPRRGADVMHAHRVRSMWRRRRRRSGTRLASSRSP